MKKLVLLLFVFLFNALFIYANNYPVEFIKVNKSITIHRSYEMYNGYKTPSNGLIVESEKGVLLIDTAWNNDETNQIIEYVNKTIKKKIQSIIITHSHSDRVGGIESILKNNISVYMSRETYELIHKTFPYQKIKYGNQEITGIDIDIEYFGPAHSKDNIVVYFIKENVLFGGCIVKSMESKTIGNIEDADIKNWLVVIDAIIKKYRNMKIVIPGHGEAGNSELLTHTRDLLK